MHDPFNRTRIPVDFSRAGRVRLLGEFCEALLRGEMPADGPRLFVAGGIAAWLAGDGDLLRDCWKVRGPQGSTATASVLWTRLREERQDGGEDRRSADRD